MGHAVEEAHSRPGAPSPSALLPSSPLCAPLRAASLLALCVPLRAASLLLPLCAAATAIPRTPSAAPTTTTAPQILATEESVVLGEQAPLSALGNLMKSLIKENRRNSELLRSLIEKNVRNAREQTKNFNELISEVKTLKMKCSHPWQAFYHLCLLLVNEEKIWIRAHEYCVARGGVLTWIRNKEEHQFINKFLKPIKMSNLNYYVGLHREAGGSLQWSGSASSYRGAPLTQEEKVKFTAKKGTTEINGDLRNWPLPFLCRRY